MRSSLPKMLHPVCGRPMVAWPILAAREAGAGRVVAIVSPNQDIGPGLPGEVEIVTQPQPNGTGGAVRAALPLIEEAETVLVLSGDHPLISAEKISGLLDSHAKSGAAATMLTIELDDPGSYGRVVRTSRRRGGAGRRGQGRRRRHARAAGDPRDQRRHLRLPGGAARRGARRAFRRQRPGRVLPARCPAGSARGRPRGRRPSRRRPGGDDGRQQPRRPRRGRGRGATPHPRGATCLPGSRSSTPARPGSTPRSRSRPTCGSSQAPACVAGPRSAPARRSARSAR